MSGNESSTLLLVPEEKVPKKKKFPGTGAKVPCQFTPGSENSI